MTRFVLLTRTGESYVLDFGSAARHHELYSPWLTAGHSRAGLVGLRGFIPASVGLFDRAADEIVALVTDYLYRQGSDDVEAINAASGECCNPPATSGVADERPHRRGPPAEGAGLRRVP